MIKSTCLYLGLASLLALPAIAPAQDNPAATAVSEAVKRQHDTIVLRQKLAEAKVAAQRSDTLGAAKLYQDAVTLAKEIGRAGIEPETQSAVAGLATTSLELAREAQSNQNYREAATRVQQVLNADPKNVAALEFKRRNDEMLVALRGKVPDGPTMEVVAAVQNQKTQSATYVQDGKVLYEAGKLDEATQKLTEAIKLDPDNQGAYYYQKLIAQGRYTREMAQHEVDTQNRMAGVEKQWVLPRSSANLPTIANPYATNTLIYTGPGRQAIVAKLDRIRLDSVTLDGPLTAVLDDLSKLSKLRDPERKGVNFLINPNPDQSGPAIASAGGGLGGLGGGFGAPPGAQAAPVAIDPQTGLPVAAPAGGTGGEKVDIGTAVTVKLNLTDVRLADVLEAIVEVAEHPEGHNIKYSIKDYAVVISEIGRAHV